jgi:RNA polymerase sigma-70 factor (ECF subfamily)
MSAGRPSERGATVTATAVTRHNGLGEAELLERLRDGDDVVLTELVERYHGAMVRVACGYVRSRHIAEEVVQDTWLAVVMGLDRFQGRSTLRTWIFRILVNQAKTRGVRDRRAVPTLCEELADGRPLGPGDVLAGELRACIREAIEALPARQRQVIVLRDIEGWRAEEVCDLLGLSEANQRVLLHRARGHVREALRPYLEA